MSESLENQFIADEYVGILHTDYEQLSSQDNGLAPVFDGKGNRSALSLQRSDINIDTGIGASVVGGLSSTRYNTYIYPDAASNENDLLVSSGTSKTLTFSSIVDLFASVNPGGIDNGVYYNPTITITGGLITGIETGPRIITVLGNLDTQYASSNPEIYYDGLDPGRVSTAKQVEIISTLTELYPLSKGHAEDIINYVAVKNPVRVYGRAKIRAQSENAYPEIEYAVFKRDGGSWRLASNGGSTSVRGVYTSFFNAIG